jgi:hypothetical protein
MPKNEIDYSNTIIYKITCKDVSVTDVYVGHTTNFVQRKHAHKQGCINNNCKLYEVIRANGGWSNWKMEIINFFECKDHYEAKPKIVVPNIKLIAIEKEILSCSVCNIHCNTTKALETHNKTNKHLKRFETFNNTQIATKKSPIFIKNTFDCECCDYKCSKNSEYIKHLLTAKHIGNVSGNKKISNTFACKTCNKVYKSRKGLWSHNKKCNVITNINTCTKHNADTSEGEVKNLTTMVMELMKSNNELQKQMLEVCKNSSITNNINNSHTNNSHNKTFNLQFFLNEQCKDAMNISEFVNSFDLQLSDLESVGDLGYIEGMTKIFLDKLNSMDIYKRPIHCSDVKREILYIKDEDKWEKELRSNPKLRHAIKTVSFKNMKVAVLWSDTYPDSKSSESTLNDVYMKIIKQSTGGDGEIGDSENKIIKRRAKEIFIDKNIIKLKGTTTI